VLVTWSDTLKKCVATLEPIIEGTFTSVEFKKALEYDYKIVKLHRLDRYKYKPSLWADTLKQLYIDKMANSSNTPPQEEQDRLVDQYEQAFGMGQAVRDSFPWEKNPAKKQTAKIQLNSGWGKHAERPIMPESKVIDDASTDEIFTLLQNLSCGNYELKDIVSLSESKTMYKYTISGESADPNLHKAYLPAGLFVPAYGRLMLWEQLHKLGDRVLMHDTDSIVYIYDPDKYNIPAGDLLGEWAIEDIDSENGGIRTFVGMCPKSYALKTNNPDKTLVKIKGLSLKWATRDIIKFDVLEKMVKEYLDKVKNPTTVNVPQMNFSYRLNHEMTTRYFLKHVAFKPSDLKGDLDENGVLYPYGWMK